MVKTNCQCQPYLRSRHVTFVQNGLICLWPYSTFKIWEIKIAFHGSTLTHKPLAQQSKGELQQVGSRIGNYPISQNKISKCSLSTCKSCSTCHWFWPPGIGWGLWRCFRWGHISCWWGPTEPWGCRWRWCTRIGPQACRIGPGRPSFPAAEWFARSV